MERYSRTYLPIEIFRLLGEMKLVGHHEGRVPLCIPREEGLAIFSRSDLGSPRRSVLFGERVFGAELTCFVIKTDETS